MDRGQWRNVLIRCMEGADVNTGLERAVFKHERGDRLAKENMLAREETNKCTIEY